MKCLHQLLKSRHLFVVLFQTWNHGKKRKAILLLAYIADVRPIAPVICEHCL